MLAPVRVGSGYKSFTDCYTYNNGGTPLSTVPISVTADSGYSFLPGDVAIAATSSGTYPTGSGWSRIVDGQTDIWIKTLGVSDTFDSNWTNADNWTLFYSGIIILVYRSPYGANALYYASNENTYSTTVNSNGPHTIPAVSRSSFEDSAFYYRFDVTHAFESWGSYYNGSFDYPDDNLWGGYTNSSNCANTYVFLTSPGEILGIYGFLTPNLSGSTGSFYTIGNSNNTITVRTTTLWIRGHIPAQSGVML